MRPRLPGSTVAPSPCILSPKKCCPTGACYAAWALIWKLSRWRPDSTSPREMIRNFWDAPSIFMKCLVTAREVSAFMTQFREFSTEETYFLRQVSGDGTFREETVICFSRESAQNSCRCPRKRLSYRDTAPQRRSAGNRASTPTCNDSGLWGGISSLDTDR